MAVSFAGGTAEGLERGFGIGNQIQTRRTNTQLANRKLELEEGKLQQAEAQKEAALVNNTIEQTMALASQFSEQFKTGGFTGTPEEFQEGINQIVDQAKTTATLAASKGLPVTSPDLIEGQRQALLGTPDHQTVQERELADLKAKETVKAEVRQETRAPTELETFSQLKTAEQLTPEQQVQLQVLEDKYNTNAKGEKIFSTTKVIDTANGPQVHGITDSGELRPLETPDGKPAIDETARMRRVINSRLEDAESRKMFQSLDKQYKDFAFKNRPFMDLMLTYDQVADDPDVRLSVKDDILIKSYIRRIKPTGTISSNFDINSVDELKSLPEGIKVGIRGVLQEGKTLPEGIRKSIITFLRKEYARSKAREDAVISNAKQRAESMNQQWVAPIFVPSETGTTEVSDDELELSDDEVIRRAKEIIGDI